MRVRYGLALIFAAIPAVAILGQGCSSDTEDNTTTQDASTGDALPKQDVQTVQDSAPTCDVDADLTTFAPTDASLNDAGASVGLCVGCMRQSCSSGIAQCNDDCECTRAVVKFYDCMSAGGSLEKCGQQSFIGLQGTSGAIAQTLGLCMLQFCTDKCGVPDQDGGPGDAASDG